MSFEDTKLKTSRRKSAYNDTSLKSKLKAIENTPFANNQRWARFKKNKELEIREAWLHIFETGDMTDRKIAAHHIAFYDRLAMEMYERNDRIRPSEPIAIEKYGLDHLPDDQIHLDQIKNMSLFQFIQYTESILNSIEESIQDKKYQQAEAYLDRANLINSWISGIRSDLTPVKLPPKKPPGRPFTTKEMDDLKRYAERRGLKIYDTYVTPIKGQTGGWPMAVLYRKTPEEGIRYDRFLYNRGYWSRSGR